MNRRSFFTLLLAALGLGTHRSAQTKDPAWVPCEGQTLQHWGNPHMIYMREMPAHNHSIIDYGHSHTVYPQPINQGINPYQTICQTKC